MRQIRRFRPEQITVDLSDQIIAFEFLTVVQLGILERQSLFALALQASDLLGNRVVAEVRKLSVELMFTLINCKAGVRNKIIVEELFNIRVPFWIGSSCDVCVRLISVTSGRLQPINRNAIAITINFFIELSFPEMPLPTTC